MFGKIKILFLIILICLLPNLSLLANSKCNSIFTEANQQQTQWFSISNYLSERRQNRLPSYFGQKVQAQLKNGAEVFGYLLDSSLDLNVWVNGMGLIPKEKITQIRLSPWTESAIQWKKAFLNMTDSQSLNDLLSEEWVWFMSSAYGESYVAQVKVLDTESGPIIELTSPLGNTTQLSPHLVGADSTHIAQQEFNLEILQEMAQTMPLPIPRRDPWQDSRQALLDKTLSDGHIFKTPYLYDYLLQDEQLNALIIKRWLSFIPIKTNDPNMSEKYRKMYDEIYSKFGWQYTTLLADPGIVNRFDDLVLYLDTNFDKNSTPYEVRQQLSQVWGEVEVYRALMLTETEALDIRENGLLPFSLREQPHVVEMKWRGHLTPQPDNYNDLGGAFSEMFSRINMLTSLASSVTSFPEVGVAATAPFAGRNVSKKMYLLKLRVPRIDVSNIEDMRHESSFSERMSIGSQAYSFGSADVESFIFGLVEPHRIEINPYNGPIHTVTFPDQQLGH